MALHHHKHHAAYVAGANTALEELAVIRETGDLSTIAMLEKNVGFHLSGHMLHSVFWTNLSPHGGGEPTGALAELLDETFGGVPAFRQQMTPTAATIQGSGWALASWEPVAGRLVVQQVHDHQGHHRQGTVPLLALDSPSTRGSTPTTSSTRTGRPTSSPLSGTSSTGTTSPAA